MTQDEIKTMTAEDATALKEIAGRVRLIRQGYLVAAGQLLDVATELEAIAARAADKARL
ncbi:MAG: hypothetical protein AAFN05_14355 [Pseudomonadota bacterium]